MRFYFNSIWLAILLLSACSNGQAPKTITISGADSAYGLMVVGVAIDRYDTIFGMKAYGTVSTLELGWARWDTGAPRPSSFSGSDHIKLALESCGANAFSMLTPTSKDCDLSKMQYYVIQVKPGNYRLAYLNHSSGNFHYTTAITDSDKIMTHIGAGEIIYIGDLTINAYANPMKIVKYGRNDQGARQALSDFPNVHGELMYRKPAADIQ